MNKKSFIFGFIIFLGFVILTYFFPITGIDITWSLKGIDNLSSIMILEDSGFISYLLTALFLK